MREQLYRTLGPLNLLQEDRRNFAITRQQLASVSVKKGWSLKATRSVGSVRIERGTGRVLNLILVGDQNADAIAASLRLCWPDVEVTGTAPKLVPACKRRLPSDAKNDRLVTLAVVFMAAAGVCVLAIFVKEPRWQIAASLLAIAGLCSWIAYHLIKRWQKNETLKKQRHPGP